MARSPRKPAPEAATPPAAAPPAAAPQSLVDRIVGASKNTSVIVAAIAAVLALLVGLTTQLPTLWKVVGDLFKPKPPVERPFADISGKWCVLNTVVDANDPNAKGDENVFRIQLTGVPDTAKFSGTGSKAGANGSRSVPGSELTIQPSAVRAAEFQLDFVEQVYKKSGALSEVQHPGWFTWTLDHDHMSGSYTIKNGFGGTSEAVRWTSDDCADFVAKSSRTTPPA
jgi:hypothetical protein